MTTYFIAPDAHNVPTLWRENGDLPQPVATRHQFRDDPEVWAALVKLGRPDPYAWPTGCGHRLAGGALACARTDDHEPGRGCTYAASAGLNGKASEPTGSDA